MALYDSLRPFTILLSASLSVVIRAVQYLVILSMVVSNVWGRGGESTKRTLFDPMRSSGQTIWKFQQEVSFFSLARCFIGEKYELRGGGGRRDERASVRRRTAVGAGGTRGHGNAAARGAAAARWGRTRVRARRPRTRDRGPRRRATDGETRRPSPLPPSGRGERRLPPEHPEAHWRVP